LSWDERHHVLFVHKRWRSLKGQELQFDRQCLRGKGEGGEDKGWGLRGRCYHHAPTQLGAGEVKLKFWALIWIHGRRKGTLT